MRQPVTRLLVLLLMIVTAITGASFPVNAAYAESAYTCTTGQTIPHWPLWDLIDTDFIGTGCTGSGTYDIVITVTGHIAGQYRCGTLAHAGSSVPFTMQAYDCFLVTP
ncbi:hypothetical protein GCM10009677_23170 [Sphaerisporangium rubeum]|uniref:Ig-like domain-containing protein n=1 Tax=Sphaerisporangium rubeum TaxID=321317 RepID=A0A7X0IKH1_9ACTN|nr:hypothetical protein [Sphaerisporangium rubeum]MBB6476394.1 hypothetical protein [Sphaerisporangium rubeum]